MDTPAEVTCYLSLGSNLGDREAYLRAALQGLAGLPGAEILAVSSLYDTAPVGETDQPRFLNLVAELRVRLSPLDLLHACQALENTLGRTRERHWGPRTIDIDLLMYDEVVWQDEELTLPHPRMTERQFVLLPLAEIAPDLRLPKGRTAAQDADPQDPAVTRVGPLS